MNVRTIVSVADLKKKILSKLFHCTPFLSALSLSLNLFFSLFSFQLAYLKSLLVSHFALHLTLPYFVFDTNTSVSIQCNTPSTQNITRTQRPTDKQRERERGKNVKERINERWRRVSSKEYLLKRVTYTYLYTVFSKLYDFLPFVL